MNSGKTKDYRKPCTFPRANLASFFDNKKRKENYIFIHFGSKLKMKILGSNIILSNKFKPNHLVYNLHFASLTMRIDKALTIPIRNLQSEHKCENKQKGVTRP